ncbi:hypothetical protein ABEX25_23260 [Paenibacillus thiaminolyticus]|uniref:hypothetical protein n=1 Tax=Paenibacillus thiaminolyticus TaxID=49283 RepID=UPI003D2D0516
MGWNKSDLSQYNHAQSPWYNVWDNGKVDIANERGSDSKIGLMPSGMYKLVADWLASNHRLGREEKDRLIDLLK